MTTELQPASDQKVWLAGFESIPSGIRQMLGPPPLLPTEDPEAYYIIVAQLASCIRPGEDLITWMMIKDLADQQLEIARYRRIQANLLSSGDRANRRSVMKSFGALVTESSERLQKMAQEESLSLTISGKTSEEVEKAREEIAHRFRDSNNHVCDSAEAMIDKLASASTTEVLIADGFSFWIENVERMNLLLAIAEKRFDETLERLNRYLHGFGRIVRENLKNTLDGTCGTEAAVISCEESQK